jgi:hypothetical protein
MLVFRSSFQCWLFPNPLSNSQIVSYNQLHTWHLSRKSFYQVYTTIHLGSLYRSMPQGFTLFQVSAVLLLRIKKHVMIGYSLKPYKTIVTSKLSSFLSFFLFISILFFFLLVFVPFHHRFPLPFIKNTFFCK